ncbi:type I-F CRISPR-associated protein Csy3 [Thioalkalivibrio sp. ALE23]|uniref:type I-F CRISPR-associated protein Csy3 n=1 Tax=Thioalkalivibrio sp. ALE23 TaxID=1265495 RepID=UPI00037460FE|nr:type I-F CRISPR-associated protein Csy3 [Thioalkalivibrio sp. ALE23]
MKLEPMKKLPAVLSFQRATVISHGEFFNILEDGAETPLTVIRHGIRGTQNVNKKEEHGVSNMQITESAMTDRNAIGFGIRFALRYLPIDEALHACAPGKKDDEENLRNMRNHVRAFTKAVKGSKGLKEVSERVATNILNGRWLWRNRSLASDLTIIVKMTNENGENVGEVTSKPAGETKLSYNNFENRPGEVKEVGEKIAESLSGEGSYNFEVTARVDLGFKGSLEVHPSQNYVEGKPSGKKGGFARPLFKIGHPEKPNMDESSTNLNDVRTMGVAAIRDQKIGNALRTIDTWYPGFEKNKKPIPVEPQGANLEQMTCFRKQRNSSAFDIAKDMGNLDPDSKNGMFLIAALMRGGVYGSESED